MDNTSLAHHYYEFYPEIVEEGHCIMVNVPKHGKLMEFIAKIPNEVVYEEEDEDYGKTEDPHITVFHGLEPLAEQKAKRILSQIPKKLVAELGQISKFENPNSPFDVLKISVKSPHLSAIHETLKRTCENQCEYADYDPHVTLAYVKKGTCNEYIGNNMFSGTKVLFETFLYSNGNRSENHEIPMKEYRAGTGGGYGGGAMAGGAPAPMNWAGTQSGPQTSRRLQNYPASRRYTYMQGNTVIGSSLYDTITGDDLKHDKFTEEEIFAGLRYEMKHMEYPDKDRARPIVLQNLEKNPKYYSDLSMYLDSDKI